MRMPAIGKTTVTDCETHHDECAAERAHRPCLSLDHLSSIQPPAPKRRWFVWGLVMLLVSPGCAGYQFGARSMFRPDIRTIHVPIARNETFRHDVGVRVTEAIIRRIQEKTPYIVTGDPNADSVLNCRFVAATKTGLTETDTDELRAFDTVVAMEASWIARNGTVLMQNRVLPTGNLALSFTQDSRVVPEAGQPLEVELQAAVEDLADRVVAQMEARW